MNDQSNQDRLTTHTHRLVFIVSYFLILVVGIRRSYDLVGRYDLRLLLWLLSIFTLLYTSESQLSIRIKSFPKLYLILQIIIVQILGIFQDYQDTWALLYIPLGFQVAVRFSRKGALVWYSLFTTLLLVTLSAEFGLVSGPGRALAYIVIGVLLISYDNQYSQHEDALIESQMLLDELKDAHEKLQVYASQADKLAAEQARDLMIQELYDSVGQKIFIIQRAARAACLIVETDPHKAAEQIDDLQAQTQATLSQMRQLIKQWHPE